MMSTLGGELVSNPYDGRVILRCDVCGARVIELCYLDGHTIKEDT